MASQEQRQLMQDFYDQSGFEFMGKERARASNPVEFIAMWDRNIQWLHDVANETDGLINEYRLINT